MAKKNQQATPRLLTETELELMSILWRIRQGSVHDVMEGLSTGRTLAYTSVSTILRILEQKKFVQSQKTGRGHTYSPLVPKDQYESSSVQHLVTKVFDGVPSSMVRRLLETSQLSEEELQSIRVLLAERSAE